jgi:hypothetical protein
MPRKPRTVLGALFASVRGVSGGCTHSQPDFPLSRSGSHPTQVDVSTALDGKMPSLAIVFIMGADGKRAPE